MKRLIATTIFLLIPLWVSSSGAATRTYQSPTNGSSICGQKWAVGTATITETKANNVEHETVTGTATTTGHGSVNQHCGPMPAGIVVAVVATIEFNLVVHKFLVFDVHLATQHYGSISATIHGITGKISD